MTYTDDNPGGYAMVEMSDIIDKLAEGTQQNRVPWKTAASDKSFFAVFGNQSVLISSESIGVHTTTKLFVLDEKGDEIDRAEYDSHISNGKYPQLRELYQVAKRRAIGADRKLAELIAQIEAAPPIAPS